MFDIVEHDMLLGNLKHYDIHGMANDKSKSYLLTRKQFVSINGCISKKDFVKYGVA